MKVVSYHSAIPIKNNKYEKKALLEFFIEGVNRKGDIGINHKGANLLDCNVAVLQGFVHEGSKNLPHLILRKNIIDKQKITGNRTLIADSNLFLYLNKENTPFHYLRYSFDGVFRRTGFYFDKDIDFSRFKKIQKDLNIDVKNYRTTGDHILICLQRNNGWSMQGHDVINILENTIGLIKTYTDRPIIVRGHPGDKKTAQSLQNKMKNCNFSCKNNLIDDLKNAWATLTYNSSPGVASLIEGVPVFQLDPCMDNSMYGEVANTNLKRLEDPKLFDREQWLAKISMSHWKFEELRSGEAWDFMKQYV